CDSGGPSEESITGSTVASVRIEADTDTLAGPGDVLLLSAIALADDGTLLGGQTVSWTSLDPEIAAVDAAGRLQGEDFGETFVRAEAGGKIAQRRFVVADPLPQTTSTPVLAVVNVDVVSMARAGIDLDQTVVVRDGRIQEVGPSSSTDIPSDAVRIEANRNQPWYLMPGLADMHVHMTGSSSDQDDHLRLYVANGVTTVREMWSNGNSLRQRDRVELGAIGPRIYAASPGMDGPGGPWAQSTPPVADPDQARALVRRYKDEGYDFVKVYNLLEVEVYRAIVDEANQVGLPVIGHVPQKVDLQMALDLEQYSMEHLLGLGPHVSSTRSLNTGSLNMASVNEWAGKVAASHTWNSPTLTVDMLSSERVHSIRTSEVYRYVPTSMRNFFETGFFQGFSETLSQSIERNHKTMLKALRDAGAPILLGTDAGFGYIIPGFAIHDELAHLVDAGLTPFEALAAGTSGAAGFLGGDSEFGTVEAGKSADLILVYGDPLQDVSRVRHRLGVMLRGRWFSETRLRSMLEDIAARHGN
ncbi:MAG: amidohydrolase family protein, partial [Rhodothermales bacterium]|nr:amidohydrolase family protein [Rhodothermales bacterium]